MVGQIMRTASAVVLLCGVLARSAPAQERRASSRVPGEAKRLVVQVIGYFAGSDAPEVGAGIVIGATAKNIFIATARHVLFREAVRVRDLRVVFPGDTRDSVQATPMRDTRAGLDLAVISVPIASARALRSGLPPFDRRGDVRSLRSGAPVSPVGCHDICWDAPTPPDQVLGKDLQGIIFQSSFIGPGSSGGALFNQWWEVVGMVTVDAPPRGEAIPIDRVVDQVRFWGYPADLKKTAVPRGGYRTTVGVSLMASPSGDPVFPVDRIPSGRVTIAHRVLPALGWHAGVLRLTPENVSITAGVAGANLYIKGGRFAARPYAEVGFGRVEARYAADSVPVTSGWIPLWTSVQQDGLGAGGGVSFEIVAVPRTILEIGIGYWRFSIPEAVPRPSGIFVSAGLRAGL